MTKELNTGEPVAWMGKTRGEIHKCADGKIYPFKAWSQSNIALYSQCYVNQLLEEIGALKAQIKSMGESYEGCNHSSNQGIPVPLVSTPPNYSKNDIKKAMIKSGWVDWTDDDTWVHYKADKRKYFVLQDLQLFINNLL